MKWLFSETNTNDLSEPTPDNAAAIPLNNSRFGYFRSMEIYNLTEDISVFARPVDTFPNGIKEAFGALMNGFGDRAYYGISWFNAGGEIVYYAGAEKISTDKNAPTGMEILTITQGEYDSETVKDWLQKTDQIKDVFDRLMGDRRPDKFNPCIEWYRSDEEMLCMMKKS